MSSYQTKDDFLIYKLKKKSFSLVSFTKNVSICLLKKKQLKGNYKNPLQKKKINYIKKKYKIFNINKKFKILKKITKWQTHRKTRNHLETHKEKIS